MGCFHFLFLSTQGALPEAQLERECRKIGTSGMLLIQSMDLLIRCLVRTSLDIQVYPVMTFPDASINHASQAAVEKHRSEFASSCRILRQRHTVELIPLTKVNYSWKGNPNSYFVYGVENKVFTENYPATCCCCSVM
ncbi:protein SSUH2 homolog isoform X1 [Ambystoma mexicanum]|uniref:protein SSUH2 homolog isoform X1 n=1 Tax=Ambystoma mexicanum TaxID=8296 RepID=UPI0037E85AF6